MFDQRQGSSDGGAILLKAAERRLGLTSALAAGLRDDRQPGKVRHELSELITQRVMAIALGYEDANDAARLACDPIHKLLVGRDPVDGEDLASQPTLSRFENAPDSKELLRMTEALADCVIERHRQRLHGRARRITIDMDPTDDPTHGQQEFTFFNSHYDSYCYLPMVCFLTFNEEAEQYLVAAVLRRGNATASVGALGILRRLIARVSDAFPKAKIRVRLDGGFASPEVLDFLDCEPKVEYLVNMAANAVLKRKAEAAMKRARRASEISGQTEHFYGECRYATRKTWPWKRRALCRHQLKTESAVDLREDLLSAGRRRKPDQGAARRHADRPDQLLELLGEHISGATDGGGVCADARDAPALVPHSTRPGASLDHARAFSKTRSPSHRLGASHRAALASGVSVPR
jgi:hypothetical protein